MSDSPGKIVLDDDKLNQFSTEMNNLIDNITIKFDDKIDKIANLLLRYLNFYRLQEPLNVDNFQTFIYNKEEEFEPLNHNNHFFILIAILKILPHIYSKRMKKLQGLLLAIENVYKYTFVYKNQKIFQHLCIKQKKERSITNTQNVLKIDLKNTDAFSKRGWGNYTSCYTSVLNPIKDDNYFIKIKEYLKIIKTRYRHAFTENFNGYSESEINIYREKNHYSKIFEANEISNTHVNKLIHSILNPKNQENIPKDTPTEDFYDHNLEKLKKIHFPDEKQELGKRDRLSSGNKVLSNDQSQLHSRNIRRRRNYGGKNGGNKKK